MLTAAVDPLIGTWQMNVAKSRFSPGPAPRNVTVVYSQDGDWITARTEGVDGDGQPIKRTNRMKMDGNAYPMNGPNGQGTMAIKIIDDHTRDSVSKFDGGHSITTRTVFSKDWKTRTLTSRGMNAKGQKVDSVIVFERQ
jgi:hypothetical protein